MNIFKKIKLINKVAKAADEIKKFINNTHLDEEISTIINAVKNLVKKYPELKNAYLTIIEILK